jgi:chromosomal replication initiator protein
LSGDIAQVTWQECLRIIKDNINYQKYKSWFEPIKPVKLENHVLTIQVPSQFWYEWLEEHYYNMLRTTIAKVIGPEGKLQYSVVLEKSDDQYEQDRSVRLPQRPVPPQREHSIPSYPE